MKRKIKSNYLCIFSLFILLVILLFNVCSYIKTDKDNKKSQREAEQYCEKLSKDELEKHKTYCELAEQNKKIKTDFYSMVTWTFAFGLNSTSFIIFLLITIPSLTLVCKYLKNNILKNELQRKSYKSIILQLLKTAYKPAFILPLLSIVTFIICYCYTRTFEFENGLLQNTIIWQRDTVSNPWIFMLVYLIKVFSLSILYINISLCIARKHHNFLIATIISYLTFIGIEAFLEIVINALLFGKVLKTDFGYIFNILSVFSLQDGYGLLAPVVFAVLSAIISTIIMLILYKNKEQLFIDCEKNE